MVGYKVFIYQKIIRKDSMDIVKVNDAMDTLNSLLNPNDFANLQRQVGQAVIKFQEDKAETRYRDDLNFLGIDMKLDVNENDYIDSPF